MAHATSAPRSRRRAALLLVSQAFLASSYIMSRELPALLVKLDGAPMSCKLLWFLVSHCDLLSSEMGRKIAQRQSLLPLDKALASLEGSKRRDFLEELQRTIARAVAN